MNINDIFDLTSYQAVVVMDLIYPQQELGRLLTRPGWVSSSCSNMLLKRIQCHNKFTLLEVAQPELEQKCLNI